MFLKEHGIRTRILRKLSEGSEEILDAIRAGYVSYVINTRAILSGVHYEDGAAIRRCAIENNITVYDKNPAASELYAEEMKKNTGFPLKPAGVLKVLLPMRILSVRYVLQRKLILPKIW